MNKKVALITGSTQGIGRQIAKELAEDGYIVYINGRNLEKLNETASQLKGRIKLINADLTIDLNIKNATKEIFQNEERLDLVIANIGDGKTASGWNVDIEEYKKIFDINFFSAVSLSTHSIEYMKKNGGHIIFISSIAGCESLGAPITYSSAKTALLSYAKNLSNDVAKLNIRVNCISPGNVMFNGSTWDSKIENDRKSVEEYIEENVPLNTFATPSDISKTVIYLENCSFITGSNIIVDGGQLNKII